MQLTSQDKKAAREGFAYVVIRGGKRVCYASTLAEAKRECGSKGKVVSISGMRYTAQNPHGSLNVRNPAKSATFGSLAIGDKFKFGGNICKKISKTKYVTQASGPFPAMTLEAEPFYNVQRLAKNPSLNVRNPSLNVRNPAKQPVVVYEYEGGEIVNAQLIDYASDLASAKHAAERMGYAVSSVKHGDFGWGSSWVTGYEVKVKQSNPSAAGVGHSVGKHAKYAARGAGRVAKSAWHGTKSFFGSAYASFKKHNPTMGMSLIEFAFKQGVDDAERRRLADGNELHKRYLKMAKGDYELSDRMVEEYMNGVEYAASLARPKRRNPSLNVR